MTRNRQPAEPARCCSHLVRITRLATRNNYAIRDIPLFSLDRIHNPGDAIMSVSITLAALLVASYPVIKMIGWWMEGGAEPLLAAVSIFMYFVLIVMAASAPSSLAILIFCVILASAIFAPIIGRVSDHTQLARMETDRMERYARALEENPMNPAARIALAEGLYKRGDAEHAIEHMEWTLSQFPAMSMRIRPQLESWKRERERIGVPQPLFCHECLAENAWNATHCYECGAAFGSRAGMKQQVYELGGPRVVIRGWLTTCAVLFISVGLFMALPPEFAGVIAVAVTIVAAWLFLRWAGGDMGTVGD